MIERPRVKHRLHVTHEEKEKDNVEKMLKGWKKIEQVRKLHMRLTHVPK